MKEIIQKAVEGGWNEENYDWDEMYSNFYMIIDGSIIPVDDEKVIFSHGFLRCFFKYPLLENDRGLKLENWQYHAQQLVLAEDRIKYLRKFIDNSSGME